MLCCVVLDLTLIQRLRSALCAGVVSRVVDGGAGVCLRIVAVLVVLRERAVGVRRKLLWFPRGAVQHPSQGQPDRQVRLELLLHCVWCCSSQADAVFLHKTLLRA